MAQDPGTQPKRSGFTNTKLRLTAPNPNAKGKYAFLSFDIWNNNPRIRVQTNDPALTSQENSYGRIEAALDYPCMFAIIELLKRAINSKEPTKSKVENFGNPRGSDPKNPVHLTDVWVGRDDKGGIYISVIIKKDNWPVIKFLFGPSDQRFHKFYNGDGTEMTREERSVVYARAYLTILEHGMGNSLINHYTPPPPSNFSGNRNNGGYNKGGNNNGYQKNNYQSKPQPSYSSESDGEDSSPGGDDFDDGDDIPFN